MQVDVVVRFKSRLLAISFGMAFVSFVIWAYYPTVITDGVPLTFKVEGALDSKLNLRDAGASINQCSGKKILPEGKIWRSSGFFSGWSCDRVGNPDVIYSLNYSDAENRRYYCRDHEELKIGRTFQHEMLSDLEFLSTWETQAGMVKDVCAFFKSGLSEIESGKRILMHCEAGRDRTGAMTALIAGWFLEQDGELTDAEIQAIECDYRKSSSLSSDKYGRITKFLEDIRSQGGVRRFIANKCHE